MPFDSANLPFPPFRSLPPRRRPWLAVILSLFFGPVAQVYCGRLRRAFLFIGLGVFLSFVVDLSLLSYFPWGLGALILSALLIIVFWLSMSIDAWFLARRSSPAALASYQLRWFYVLFFIGYLLLQMGEAGIIKTYCVETFYMVSPSMKDAILAGDRVLVDKLWYHSHPIRRGEIIAYFNMPSALGKNPASFSACGKPEACGHRVIGLPGDRVEVRGEAVYVNDRLLTEPYARYRGPKAPSPFLTQLEKFGPQTVPEGHLFLLGDNRRRSADSRTRGFFLIGNVIGRVQIVYWSSVPKEPPFPAKYLSPGQANPDLEEIQEQAGAIRWERLGLRPNEEAKN